MLLLVLEEEFGEGGEVAGRGHQAAHLGHRAALTPLYGCPPTPGLPHTFQGFLIICI